MTGDADVNAAAVAVKAVAASAVAAKHAIDTRLLALARAIMRPKTYVGYSAFVLMGLATKCQPCVWEGSNFINLLTLNVPWALDS